jgi:hypothetical protein
VFIAPSKRCCISHRLHRSSVDKRHAVEIALNEFPDMSDRAIAELRGVNHHLVADVRPKPMVGKSPAIKERIGRDGVKHPATKPKKPIVETVNRATEVRLLAERQMGEFLAAMPKNEGARGIGTSAVPEERLNIVLLPSPFSLLPPPAPPQP